MQIIQSIQNRIYEIRGERVMLDRDLALLYETATKRLTEAMKRNIKRFPPDFMFQLTKAEWESIKYQREAAEKSESSRSQFATLNTGRGHNLKYLPYAFTEHGVAMLSGILNSDKAVQMNIAIIRAFIEMRRFNIIHTDWKEQIRELKDRIGGHDAQLSQIYDALENLLDEKAAARKWEDRDRIGFGK
ncbi:ORF6N domain-containing protein [Agriterribacter sp.]|uniref:ORF6N domain-containing protein n=1 Tax=Agriterribacter sp. TaxID=2821509 RepID=UPI002BBBF084|nr:ORF6N domain-containing protein [Agriterribacter sp.]HTN05712.1 ORF6N domain-containing protein [Agriterribacter sp.]